MIVAPRARANCTTNDPTPPAAPCTSSRSPVPTFAVSRVSTAVVPTARSPAASFHGSDAGFGTTESPDTTSRSAYASDNGYAITSSPTAMGPLGPVTASPTSATTPAASLPSRIGRAAGSAPNAPL